MHLLGIKRPRLELGRQWEQDHRQLRVRVYFCELDQLLETGLWSLTEETLRELREQLYEGTGSRVFEPDPAQHPPEPRQQMAEGVRALYRLTTTLINRDGSRTAVVLDQPFLEEWMPKIKAAVKLISCGLHGQLVT